MPLTPLHAQHLFVRPAADLKLCGSRNLSQGTRSAYHWSGILKPDGKARGEAYQVTSATTILTFRSRETYSSGCSCGTLRGRRGSGTPLLRVGQAFVLIFYRCQICHSQLLSRGCRGNFGVRHHKVRSRDIRGSTIRLTASSSRASFLNLSRWLADARALGSPNLVVVLVGNKSDREDDREVEWAEGSKWAAENGVSILSFI